MIVNFRDYKNITFFFTNLLFLYKYDHQDVKKMKYHGTSVRSLHMVERQL